MFEIAYLALSAQSGAPGWGLWIAGGIVVAAVSGYVAWRSSGVVRAASPGSAGAPVFDVGEALALCGADPGLLRSILAGMRSECESQVAEIRAALARGDAAGLRLAAHRLKGALLIVAARPAADVALSLERAGVADDPAAGARQVGALEVELRRLDEAITAHLARPA